VASDRLTVNASPLIFLTRIEGLDWIVRLADAPVLVPQAVLREVEAGDGGAEIATRIHGDAGFSVVSDAPIPAVVTAWDLGAGETQVLAHCCHQPGLTAVLDDKAARQCARGLGVRLIGTIGLVLVAKRRGWIAHARPVIERLQAQGMFLSTDLISTALQDVGE
jgi:predicted nucleic acid-binding protein